MKKTIFLLILVSAAAQSAFLKESQTSYSERLNIKRTDNYKINNKPMERIVTFYQTEQSELNELVKANEFSTFHRFNSGMLNSPVQDIL